MSVVTFPPRTGRHPAQPAGRGRAQVAPRRPGAPVPPGQPGAGAPVGPSSAPAPAGRPEVAAPALTVTFAIPLTGDALTPQAHRLLEAVRELVELGEGTVTLADPPMGADGAQLAPEPLTEPNPPSHAGALSPADPTEVRLLAASRQVLLGDEPLPLTRLEFDLLYFLAQHPRRVFSRVQLLAAVWGYEHTGVRTVDVHVRRLRVKVGARLPLVTTVYGVGYRLADEARVTILTDR